MPNLSAQEALLRMLEIFKTALTTGGLTKSIRTSVTRPADTDLYAAGDAIADKTAAATIITFAQAARIDGGSGYITGLKFGTDQAANVSEYNLHVFNSAPVVIIVDNDNYDEKKIDIANKVGSINIPAVAKVGTAGDVAISEVTGLKVPYEAVAGSRDVVAQLETVTGFTPASGQIFFIEITVEQN